MMRDFYYEQLVSCIKKRDQRIAELEAQVEEATLKTPMLEQVRTLKESLLKLTREELIEMVETLTPKLMVVSQWANIFVEYPGDWHDTLSAAINYGRSGGEHIGRLRKDTITHPDGRVEYKLEVEP